MKKVVSILFSFQLMGFLLLLFAISIGYATIIENDYGTSAARIAVYDALWFEIMLGLLGVNLLGRLILNKTYLKGKISLFVFHLSFIIILLGAAITRFTGTEGTVHIREGQSASGMISGKTYLSIRATTKTASQELVDPVVIANFQNNRYSNRISIQNQDFQIRQKRFINNALESVVEDPNGTPILTLTVIDKRGSESLYLKPGQVKTTNGITIGWDHDALLDINLSTHPEGFTISSKQSLTALNMSGQAADSAAAGQPIPFIQRKLYSSGETQLIFKSHFTKGRIRFEKAPANSNIRSHDVLVFAVSDGEQSGEIAVKGRKGQVGEPAQLTLGSTQFSFQWGSKWIEFPFKLHLNDFQLERYPGSNSPSSFASEVSLIDPNKDLQMPFRIYMNHILKYQGYRFYQSSYDPDEKGTILSVNRDWWGTLVTYLGYLLMSLGMVFALLSKKSRFHLLSGQIAKIRKQRNALTLLLLFTLSGLLPVHAFDQNDIKQLNGLVNQEQADQFGQLLIQDNGGRIEPLNTLANEILRKVSRKSSYLGLNPNQVFLGMLAQPGAWQQIPMIKISHPDLKDLLGLTGNYAAFRDFIDFSKTDSYRLATQVQSAYQKNPSRRNLLDKEIMKVDERINICYMVYSGAFLKLFPDPNDINKAWYRPTDRHLPLHGNDSLFVAKGLSLYIEAINQANTTGDYTTAEEILNGIKRYQQKYASAIIPSQQMQKMELFYNHAKLFKRLFPLYSSIGFVLLVLLFLNVLIPKMRFKWWVRISGGLLIIGFLVHTAGLIMRWKLSGHAPWSNGYETMIYIAWATMLAGLLFVRTSPWTLAATATLAGLTLMTAHFSWMDPEITNLVPVLKSYWLTIHVSIITASYGFIGLAALLGVLALLMMIFKTASNQKRLNLAVKELSSINEMALIAGLYMLTIGTFLGGVWANESWGRYWGWDPKETWALVTILVYAFILHLRYIPGLRGYFAFNFGTFAGFSTVLMTYFGVNYYLAGLHSYAKGDPIPIPEWVYYGIAIIIVIGLFAWINEKKVNKILKSTENPPAN